MPVTLPFPRAHPAFPPSPPCFSPGPTLGGTDGPAHPADPAGARPRPGNGRARTARQLAHAGRAAARPVHVHHRRPGDQRGHAVHRRQPARLRRVPATGRGRLHDRVRDAADHRRPARRPLWAAPDLPGRRAHLHHRVAGLRAGAGQPGADRLPAGPGRGRRGAGAAGVQHHPAELHRPRPGPGAVRLRGGALRGRGDRARAGRRGGDGEPVRHRLAPGVRHQRADRDRTRRRRASPTWPLRRACMPASARSPGSAWPRWASA